MQKERVALENERHELARLSEQRRQELQKLSKISEADARAMEQLIKSVYKFAEVKVLINEEATASNIERWFRSWLIAGTQPGDRVFFFYAGQGSNIAYEIGY